MTTKRTVKHRNSGIRFTSVDNRLINDADLSPLARLAMIYLLSKPADWQLQIADLQNYLKAGVNRTKAVVSELRQAGYIDRRQNHVDGRWTRAVTDVYEIPALNPRYSELTSVSLYSLDCNSDTATGQTETVLPKQGYLPNTDEQNTETSCMVVAAVLEALRWIDEPKRTSLAGLKIVTVGLAEAWLNWYEAGDFPQGLDNPVGWAIRKIERGEYPPVPRAAPSGFVTTLPDLPLELDEPDPARWQDILNDLSFQLDNHIFETLLKGTTARLEGDRLTVFCRSVANADRLENRLKLKVAKCVRNVLGRPVELVFSVLEPQ